MKKLISIRLTFFTKHHCKKSVYKLWQNMTIIENKCIILLKSDKNKTTHLHSNQYHC